MLPSPLKKSSVLPCLLLCCFFLASSASAQVYGTASHQVTVTVATIRIIQVSAPSVNLNIDGSGAIAGQDQMSVVDQSTSVLWGVNSSNQKITVNSDLVAPLFTLRLLAVTPSQGTPAPEVTLSTTAADLLLNIGRTSGTSTLRYTGVALASQGIGTDTHALTFTITTQ